ncbi:hypothetical protein GW891_02660 [bacterium]|nr:hypothetical protein [bacterium]
MVIIITFSDLMVINVVQNIPLYIATNSITLLVVIQKIIVPIIGILFLIGLYNKSKNINILLNSFFGLEILFSLINGILPYYFIEIHTVFPNISSHTSDLIFSKESILIASLVYITFLTLLWIGYFYYLKYRMLKN